MTYNINDKFYNEYEPEVAIFCNTNGYKLVELEKEDEKRVFQIQEIVKTLNELKEKKIAELKANRDSYKKTIQINEDYTYWDCDAVNNIYNFNNLMWLVGFTVDDKNLFISKTLPIISQYNTIKDLINNSDINTINSISTSFED